MNEKIKIGHDEYRPPFSEDDSIGEYWDWIVDADGKHFQVAWACDALNKLAELLAEVERLKETQRKLAQIVRNLARALECAVDAIKNKRLPSADDQVVLAFRLGQTMEMINSDPLVAAAIAEVKGAKSERL